MSHIRIFLIGVFALLIVACQPAEEPGPAAPAEPPAEPLAQTADPIEPEAVPGDCQLNMGWDPWEPYHFAAAGGGVQGLDIDLVELLAAEAGCEIEFVQGNWASLLRLLSVGELDLLPGATHTPEREAFAHFSRPYREETFFLYVRDDDAEQWTEDSLAALLESGFRVGVTQGYIYSEDVNTLQMSPEFQDLFVEAAVGELNFTHLLDHRIDGFLEDPFVAAAIQRRRHWGADIRPLPIDLGTGEVHFLFSRQSVDERIVDRFSQALQLIREDGRHEATLARYLDD